MRRRFGILVALFALVGACRDDPARPSGPTPPQSTQPPEAAPRPKAKPQPVMFRGNARRTGVFLGTGLEDGGEVHWTFDAGDEVVSSPAVFDGRLYVGCKDKSLYALDARTGEKLWSFATDGPVASSPAVWDGHVIFGSMDKVVYALSTEKGEEVWRVETGGVVLSSPAVVDGTVFFGSGDGYLYAVDAKTGVVGWKLAVGAQVLSSPAVDRTTVYVVAGQPKETPKAASGDSTATEPMDAKGSEVVLAAVDRATHTFRWKLTTEGVRYSSPAVEDNIVIAQLGHILVAVDTGDGSVRWTHGAEEPSSPAVVGDVVIYPADELLALRVTSGEVIWRQPFDAGNSSPSVAGKTIYIADELGDLHALVLGTGERRWTISADREIVASPWVGDEMVYVGSLDHRIYAVGKPPRKSRPKPLTPLSGSSIRMTRSFLKETESGGTIGPRYRSEVAAAALYEIEKERLPVEILRALAAVRGEPAHTAQAAAEATLALTDDWRKACPGGRRLLEALSAVAPALKNKFLYEGCDFDRFGLISKEHAIKANPVNLMLAHFILDYLKRHDSLHPLELELLELMVSPAEP